MIGRNASENPAGIETEYALIEARAGKCRNASENPAGIETGLPVLPVVWAGSQRIRKPSRD